MAVRGETEVITFKANMSDLHKKLSELPGVTDVEAKKMVRSLERQLKKTERAASKAAKNTGRSMRHMEKDMRNVQRRAAKLGAAASAISPAFGSMVSGAGAVAGGIGAMLNPVGLAIGSMVALTAAVGGTAIGMFAAVRSARDLHEELQPFADIDGIIPAIPASQLAALESANAAIDGLGVVAQSALLTLGSEFAPAVEKAAIVTLKFGLMGIDAFQAFADGHDVLKELAVFLTKGFIDAIALPISGLMSTIEIMGDLAVAVGMDGLGGALIAVGDSWDQFAYSIARSGVDVAFEQTGAAFDDLAFSTQDYDATARALIGTMGAVSGGTAAVTSTAFNASAALDAMTKHLAPARDRAAELTDKIDDLNKSAGAMTAPDLTRLEELEILLASLKQEAAGSEVANLALADSIQAVSAAINEEMSLSGALFPIDQLTEGISIAQQGLQTLSASFKDTVANSAAMVNHLTAQMSAGEGHYTAEQKKQLQERIDAQKEAARRNFNAQKSAQIAEAVAATALGVIKALASSPPPSPLGAFGALTVAAAGAASIAKISQQRVTFHNASPPDEIPATVLRSERVVTSTGRGVLGDEQIRRANAGAGAGGMAPPIRVLNTYQHRVFNTFIKDGLAMGNPISEAMSAGKTIGHRGNRKGV